jgi:GNAT superfamily N-acetyltransferase
MPPGCTLRALTAADAPATLALIHAAFRAQSAPTDPPSNALRETVESVAAQIASGGGACIEADGVMAAVLLWTRKDDALYLGRLAVPPAWRRRGLARALVAAAEAKARRRGLTRMALGVRVELADNHRLFAACGFAETHRTSHPGYTRPTSIQMEKRLS